MIFNIDPNTEEGRLWLSLRTKKFNNLLQKYSDEKENKDEQVLDSFFALLVEIKDILVNATNGINFFNLNIYTNLSSILQKLIDKENDDLEDLSSDKKWQENKMDGISDAIKNLQLEFQLILVNLKIKNCENYKSSLQKTLLYQCAERLYFTKPVGKISSSVALTFFWGRRFMQAINPMFAMTSSASLACSVSGARNKFLIDSSVYSAGQSSESDYKSTQTVSNQFFFPYLTELTMLFFTAVRFNIANINTKIEVTDQTIKKLKKAKKALLSIQSDFEIDISAFQPGLT